MTALALPSRVTHVLLDLDGTLTDSAPGIVASLRHAFATLGMPVPGDDVLRTFVGPPLGLSLERHGLRPEHAALAITAYRREFERVGMLDNSLYPGIPGLLEALADAGLVTVIATAKPQPYAVRVVEHFGLHRTLHGGLGGVFGAETEGAGITAGKEVVIARALSALGQPGAGVVMVGDREHDVEGAAVHGVPTVGAGWGYGSPGELEGAGAVALAETPEALAKLLVG
ncbi:HAD hydrolase-like protein [Antribacter sp. KLBMP9083]|uniref:HAD hydrolase-like protein n=1 Tax=Antribacter soli TaxID=2910976 RepID=A0AA41QEI9_9MICO|nr:HAD family hydrolase [Antribacter soli]MCF4121983.1 HAD hydrolase-like protein [Antribacter soli]